MPSPFALIGDAWEFARKQPALRWVGIWLIFLPLLGINVLSLLMPPLDAAPGNVALGFGLGIFLLSLLMLWGDACVLLIGKRLLASSAGRSRTSFSAVRDQATGFVLPLLITDIIRSGMTILWGLLLIVPGIIYSVRTVFAPVIIVAEGKAYRLALRRSQDVVRGRTGTTLLMLLGLAVTLFLPLHALSLGLGWALDATVPEPHLLASIGLEAILSAVHAFCIIIYTLTIILLYGELVDTAEEVE